METEPIITRTDYMAESSAEYRATGSGKVAHRRYYAQFVNESTLATVKRTIGMARLLASTDQSFNDIPLREWDQMIGWIQRGSTMQNTHNAFPISNRFKEAGTWCSPGDLICIAKEAARQLVEREAS